jgi:heterodisulfide reductase subunit C
MGFLSILLTLWIAGGDPARPDKSNSTMAYIPQVAFILCAAAAVFLFAGKVREIRRNILLGRSYEPEGTVSDRVRNLLLLAFGQRKMFRNPFVAVMHLVIYAGFIIINLEVLEIVIDGLFGTHRIMAGPLGKAYGWLINSFEWLALGVILTCVVFLARRNLVRLPRFRSRDLDGWPRSDANYILLAEIVLMSLFLFMNAADTTLQGRGHPSYSAHPTGDFAVSGFLKPLLSGLSDNGLVALERACWWLHILGIFAFLNYLPWSKHLHILLAFPNSYFTRIGSTGRMTNMPEIQREVLYAMEPESAPASGTEAAPQRFGAKDVFDLDWKNLMDAYSCTECGRCSAACPANQTGKLLSPRKIMMDTRDRLEAVGRNINENGGTFKDDGRSLLSDHITEEELRACTTCNACVEECPVSISPLDIILQMRRYLVMEKSQAPQEWTMMFGNVENNFAPWKFAPDDRAKWMEEA